MKTLIQRFIIGLTLFTASGILIHDTKIDHAAVTALALPAMLMTLDLDKAFKYGADHTHVERVSFAQAAHTVSGNAPRLQPREDHKKYAISQKVTKGYHPFDGYYLPLES